MSKKDNRGRPSENVVEKLIYTQTFNNLDGTTSVWEWDKTINKNGPISVDILYPNHQEIDKINKQKDKILSKYLAKPGERKPRILKVDKQRLEELEEKLTIEYNKL